MDSSQYDYIFVGASPLMCLHAAALADRYKVLLLDDRSAIGGVWQSGTFDGKEFPCAVPHMLEPHPGVYDFLEQHLDLEMEDVTEHSHVAFTGELLGQKLHPYTRYLLHTVLTESSFNQVKQAEAQGLTYQILVDNSYRQQPTIYDNYRPRNASTLTVKYMRGGTSALRIALENKLKQSGCDICLDSAVESMTINDGDVSLNLNNKNTVTGKNTYFAQHSVPNKIFNSSSELVPTTYTTEQNNSTLQLKIRVKNAQKFFYLYFPISPYIYIASRLDYYSDEHDPEVVYIAVTMRTRVEGFSNELLQMIISELVKTGVLSDDACIENFQTVQESRKRFELADMINLSLISEGKVKVVTSTKTGGLARGIYDNMLAFS